MRQKCCGQALDYNKETDVYSCLNCKGSMQGHVARLSEDPLTPTPEEVDNIANMTGATRRPDETDKELDKRLATEKAFVLRKAEDDNMTNAVLRTMVLDRDASLHKLESRIVELQTELGQYMKVVNAVSNPPCCEKGMLAMKAAKENL